MVLSVSEMTSKEELPPAHSTNRTVKKRQVQCNRALLRFGIGILESMFDSQLYSIFE